MTTPSSTSRSRAWVPGRPDDRVAVADEGVGELREQHRPVGRGAAALPRVVAVVEPDAHDLAAEAERVDDGDGRARPGLDQRRAVRRAPGASPGRSASRQSSIDAGSPSRGRRAGRRSRRARARASRAGRRSAADRRRGRRTVGSPDAVLVGVDPHRPMVSSATGSAGARRPGSPLPGLAAAEGLAAADGLAPADGLSPADGLGDGRVALRLGRRQPVALAVDPLGVAR